MIRLIIASVLCFTSMHAETVLTQDMIYDGVLNGIKSVVKEATGQNDEAHDENCKIEYQKLYERNSRLLAKENNENEKLKAILQMNSIKYEAMTIKHLPVRKNESCSITYWDYFKSSSHDISELSKENRKIKRILTKHRINYSPQLKTNVMQCNHPETSEDEREKAKTDLKRQLAQ